MAASVQDLQARDQQLRRQEALLRQGLGGGQLGREQRRVQTRLLRQTRIELAGAARALRAVEAGWEPFQPAEDWAWGYVEDPRLLKGHTRMAAVLVAALVAAAAGIGLGLRGELLPAALTAALLLVGGQAALHEALTLALSQRDRESLVMFNSAMPPGAAVAYRRARDSGLFDSIVVHSPRAEDFRQVSAQQAPSLGLLDPVLVGRIGEQGFLIAQWDLARDLAIQPAPED